MTKEAKNRRTNDMHRKAGRPRKVLAVLALVILAGCSGGRGTASVSGTVLYKNQPVDGASVSLLPKSESAEAKPARGTTDTSGNFTVTTYFGPDDQPAGALPGEYRVTITKIDEPQGVFDPLKDPPPKSHLPAKYGTPQASPLSATVTAAGPNHFEFKLED
jgi:hypothetical protein